MLPPSKLNNSCIVIELDTENESYNVDFQCCSIAVAYAVLRNLIDRLEAGEFFEEENEVIDEYGNPVTAERARAIIRELKQELDSSSRTSSEGGITIITNDRGGSKSN